MGTDSGETRQQVGLRGNLAERSLWHAAAKAAGQDFSTWARRVLGAAAEAGGVPSTSGDPDVADALERLRAAYGFRSPADVVRLAVLAADRRFRAGLDPFLTGRPGAEGGATEPASPRPAPPAGTGPRRGSR